MKLIFVINSIDVFVYPKIIFTCGFLVFSVSFQQTTCFLSFHCFLSQKEQEKEEKKRRKKRKMENKPIILDYGSANSRVGFVGDKTPTIFPTITGKEKGGKGERVVGEKVERERDSYVVKHPIEHGYVTSWDEMKSVWEYTFERALKGGEGEGVDTENHPVMVVERARTPRANREKVGEVMFEQWEVPSFVSVGGAPLGLFAEGKLEGMVVDLGKGGTHSVVVWEGHEVAMAGGRGEIAGQEITDFLRKKMGLEANWRGYRVARGVKEGMGCVGVGGMEGGGGKKEYKLPDGEVIEVEDEARYQVCFFVDFVCWCFGSWSW